MYDTTVAANPLPQLSYHNNQSFIIFFKDTEKAVAEFLVLYFLCPLHASGGSLGNQEECALL